MATASTNVELDIELKRRVERIAEARDESAGAVIRDAVAEFVLRAERREKLGLPDTASEEFKAEYRRQRVVVARHYRETDFADHWEPTEDDLKGWV